MTAPFPVLASRRFRSHLGISAAALGCLWLWAVPATATAPAPRTAVPPLAVVTSLTPGSIAFGNPVTAVLDVHYGRGVARSSLRIAPSFDPFVPESQPAVQLVRRGVVRYSYSLLCLSAACLPSRGARGVPVGTVTVTGQDASQLVSATGHWPPARVSSRLVPSALSGKVRFRVPPAPPRPAYRITPSSLEIVLALVAASCVAVAIALALSVLTRRRPRAAPRPTLAGIALAIAYLRDSGSRDGPERRRALELLSETLDRSGRGPSLAAASARAAWSKRPPTPDDAVAFAEAAGALEEEQR